jgi:hypothetical protein
MNINIKEQYNNKEVYKIIFINTEYKQTVFHDFVTIESHLCKKNEVTC